MDILSAIFGFGQITFAILFVIPQLVTSFEVDIDPKEVKHFYLWLGIGYFIISVCGVLVLWSNLTDIITSMQGAFTAAAFLVIIFIGALGYLYARKWTLQEQAKRFADRNTGLSEQDREGSEIGCIKQVKRYHINTRKQTQVRRKKAGRRPTSISSES